jgi:glyoxylase-like metal-dependent hydrolase (beta-lactamase superfamily II)
MALRAEHLDDVTRLRMSSRGSRAVRLSVSAYVLRGVMIDTGFHRARGELWRAISQHSIRGAIVTHWHEDHAGNVAMLAERGIPILLRADTESILRNRPAIQLYRRVVWGHPPALTGIVQPFDGGGMQTLHTPGHSADHQVVWDPETGTLFSGDLWLGVRARILHSTENPYEIVDSLRRVRDLNPARMFDAHRGPVANPVNAIGAKIDWLTATIGEIERRVRSGQSDGAIVRDVLGGEEIGALISHGDYARRNLVKAVRRRADSPLRGE